MRSEERVKEREMMIPFGIRCFDEKTGERCPYFKREGELRLDRGICEYASNCKKDCKKEKCRDEFYYCSYKGKLESYGDNEFLLANSYKICGINIQRNNIKRNKDDEFKMGK